MNFHSIESFSGHRCLSSAGCSYVRFNAHEWGRWSGDVLYLFPDDDARELEAAFQEALSQQTAMQDIDPRV